jgi:hypothetical protein
MGRNPHEYKEPKLVTIIPANNELDPFFIPSCGRPAICGPVFRAIKREPTPGTGNLRHHLMKAGIERYSEGSSGLNHNLSILRYAKGYDPQPKHPFGAITFFLVRAIRTLHDSDRHARLFRGVALKESQLQQYRARIGKVIQWNAFASTSVSEKVARQFSQRGKGNGNKICVIFDIRRKPAHPTAANISGHVVEEYRDEKEVLMIPGCRFKVLEVNDDRSDEVFVVLKEVQLMSHK